MSSSKYIEPAKNEKAAKQQQCEHDQNIVNVCNQQQSGNLAHSNEII